MSRIRAVERFIAEREIGDDVALDRGFQQRPLEPGGIAQVAARHAALAVEPQPDQHIAAERFHQAEAFADFAFGQDRGVDFAVRQAFEDLLDQRQALLDFANADPHPRINVAFASCLRSKGPIITKDPSLQH